MRKNHLAVFLIFSLALVLTSCGKSQSSQPIQPSATAEIKLGCEDIKSTDALKRIRSLAHFGNAARIEPLYLELAKAAGVVALTTGFKGTLDSGLKGAYIEAQGLVTAMCQ